MTAEATRQARVEAADLRRPGCCCADGANDLAGRRSAIRGHPIELQGNKQVPEERRLYDDVPSVKKLVGRDMLQFSLREGLGHVVVWGLWLRKVRRAGGGTCGGVEGGGERGQHLSR